MAVPRKKWDSSNQFEVSFSDFELHKRADLKGRGIIPPDFHKDEGILLRHLLWRRKLNMNSILLIVGGVRTGKSWTGLKLCDRYCKLVGKKFDIREQCSFQPIDYLEWVQRGHEDDAFFLDEMGTSVSPQNWFTQQSRIFNTYTQIGGFRLNLLVMATPSISYLLKSVRFLLNYIIEMYSQGSGVVCKVRMIHRFGKGYLPTIGNIRVSKPRQSMIDIYEKQKREWNDEKLKEYIEITKFDNERRLSKDTGGAIQDWSEPKNLPPPQLKKVEWKPQ